LRPGFVARYVRLLDLTDRLWPCSIAVVLSENSRIFNFQRTRGLASFIASAVAEGMNEERARSCAHTRNSQTSNQ
jgi:hypothetical protein